MGHQGKIAHKKLQPHLQPLHFICNFAGNFKPKDMKNNRTQGNDIPYEWNNKPYRAAFPNLAHSHPPIITLLYI